MRIDGEHRRSVWLAEDGRTVLTFDQTRLPHALPVIALERLEDAAAAIAEMKIRGAPLIGAIAAYGVALAVRADPSDDALARACGLLAATRPTAVNLRWALERMRALLAPLPPARREERAYAEAAAICEEDVAINRAIGERGLPLIEAVARRKRPGEPVRILTHCNAGWLATVDWGTATAPVYLAHRKGIALHVWVDETRPRNQGAAITAFELGQEGVPHTVIADNAGGHLMRQGLVDLCIVGTDRVARNGDVANKIGTYLKALAAFDNAVPFYVALPSSTIDWRLSDGAGIPIEERSGEELALVTGRTADGRIETVRITPEGSACGNWAFDVTPARLVTALVTERGVCPASEAGLLSLFPEAAAA
ncbi:MAG: S-methyl-5-thioribose-1-phosphate isomerase [Geminicoccaceae bacterium]|nr:S-methyl-5-thioribose-1-phosphate isomerase [Geminicoccaceae bacterium]MCX7630480.1 S-methyl-5-thioribose-1-phosphate isomerase [Geminicoccaceae bacterium]MDW8369394.1 S-methyl-5-thioribose-1-phosphate isomerase [Geminicoccaceae bacterium]